MTEGNKLRTFTYKQVLLVNIQYYLFYIFTQPFRNMIGFNFFFVDPLIQNNISFTSDEYLQRSKVPLLILHAEDDWVVPMQLGEKVNFLLYN